MVTELITELMPGAGPPPTRIPYLCGLDAILTSEFVYVLP
jgi:hypothetical protein